MRLSMIWRREQKLMTEKCKTEKWRLAAPVGHHAGKLTIADAKDFSALHFSVFKCFGAMILLCRSKKSQ